MHSQANTLPLLNWNTMRLSLYWAYDGVPFYPRSEAKVDSQTAWLLRRGRVNLRWRDQKLALKEGQWVIFGSGRGEHEFSPKARLLSICFRAEWFTGQAFFDDTVPIVLNASSCLRLGQTAEQLVRIAQRISPGTAVRLPEKLTTFPMYLKLHRIYLSWLETLAIRIHRAGVSLRRIQVADERVLHAIQFVEQWPLEKPFDERIVAKSVCVSRGHFNRLFAVEVGISAKAYFDRRRLQMARERLVVDDIPIKTIAYQLGFHDTAHFSNWFRRHAGRSPSQFRKSLLVDPWEMV